MVKLELKLKLEFIYFWRIKMALQKKSKPVDVKTDDESVVETQPANEPAPTAESEAIEAEVVSEVAAPIEASAPAETIEQPAPTTSTEIAEAKTTEVAASHPGGGNFAEQSAEDGFEGVELGFFSFPSIKLPSEGIFETNGGVSLGKEVNVVVTQSKAKYLIKPAGATSKDKRVNFSYDVMKADSGTTLEGNTVPMLKAEWGVDSLEIKKYLEVPAMLVDAEGSEELDGEMVMLSIPPSGVQRFSGHLAMLKFTGKGKPSEVITKCQVGAKITNDSGDFYPWIFKYGGPA